MAEHSLLSPRLAALAPSSGPLAAVRLELRQGSAKAQSISVGEAGFLIGSVAGCDLRLLGIDLPPVLCLIAPTPTGASLRKLAPAQTILVNGRPVSSTALVDGDQITLPSVAIVVHAQPAAPPAPPTLRIDLDARSRQLDEKEKQLDDQTKELEADRVLWYRRRQEMEQELAQNQDRQLELSRAQAELEPKQRLLAQLADREQELRGQEQKLASQKLELDAVRQELAEIRQQLYDRYRERRDRLAGMQEAVERAGRNLQKQKQEFEAEARSTRSQLQDEATRQADLSGQARELAQARQALEDQRRALDEERERLEQMGAERLAQCEARERRLAEDQRTLEKGQAQYQSDLVRLDRLASTIEQREKQLQNRALEVDRHSEHLVVDSRDLEEQVQQLNDWHQQLSEQSDRLARQKVEQEVAAGQMSQRTADLEGQQAMLATLRGRLERMRSEVREESQELAELRSRQETVEAELEERRRETERVRGDMDHDRQLLDQERRQFEDRAKLMEAAVTQLRQAQENLSQEEEQIKDRAQELDTRAAQLAEDAGLLQARMTQTAEAQQRLQTDRDALKQREANLTQAEQARSSLQEQLRRRSEELNARQRVLAEQAQKQEAEAAAVAARRDAIDGDHQRAEAELAALRQDLERKAAELSERENNFGGRAEHLTEQEDRVQQRLTQLQQHGRVVAALKKELAEARTQWEADQQAVAAALDQRRGECDAARLETQALQFQLPELEQRAQGALERLSQAREQLREHLAELHGYARQSRDDLEGLRAQIQTEAEQLRQRELALDKARDEHRLAVTSFRQQIIDWQGQVAELRRSLALDESRIERRQAEVAAQARQVDATSARLAQQAENLQQQERDVAERRVEMERHLADMREWYRRKLRELAANTQEPEAAAERETPAADEAPTRDILSLTGDLDPGDRQLGDLLRELELVDPDTLQTLLVDARRQRRSLRQALLASGSLTLYQMALIEAGSLDGLVLGPVRVIDRLRVTPKESAYRVFDPRRAPQGPTDALLRHLAEEEMQDAVHPDEFRQRFAAAAAVRHPNLAATYEVLEIDGRPAVLQEWLNGLPGSDWPALAAVPGVWFRLLGQAALGLHTAHQAGLVHGRLHAGAILLTTDGLVKLCGVGEPAWLEGMAADGDAAADMIALGEIAATWIAAAGRRKAAKALTPALQTVLQRLCADKADERYASAAQLLEDLDRVGSDVSPNAEAWDRLLRHVRDHAADVAWKQSA